MGQGQGSWKTVLQKQTCLQTAVNYASSPTTLNWNHFAQALKASGTSNRSVTLTVLRVQGTCMSTLVVFFLNTPLYIRKGSVLFYGKHGFCLTPQKNRQEACSKVTTWHGGTLSLLIPP